MHALPYGHALTQPGWLEALDAAAGYTAKLAGMQAGMMLNMSLRMPQHHMPDMPHPGTNSSGLTNEVADMAAMALGGSVGQIAYNIVRRGITFVVHETAQRLTEGGASPSNSDDNVTDWIKRDILSKLPYAQALSQTQPWPEAFDSAAEYTTMLIGMFVGMKLGMPSEHMSHSGGLTDAAKSMAAMAIGESAGMVAYTIVRRRIGPAVYEAVGSLYNSVTARLDGEGSERQPLLNNAIV